MYYCKTRAALYCGYLCKGLTGRITDRISDFFGFGSYVYPGLAYNASLILKGAEDEESLFYELYGFFLYAEKQLIADETRTLEEVLHTDPLTWENVPPELKIDGLSPEETKSAWDEFRKNPRSDFKPGAAAGTGSDPDGNQAPAAMRNNQ